MSRFIELELLTENVKKELKKLFAEDVTGHDFLHTLRVLNNACNIQKNAGGDIYLITFAALLHDADDKKLFPETAGEYHNARMILNKNGADEEDTEKIIEIIRTVSFSSGIDAKSIEAKVVQDADRLDAIGAIGIARCFAYGASHGRSIYNEEDFIGNNMRESKSSIAHFYQKLLKLESLMKTEYGKNEAAKRTAFLKEYLRHFTEETDCGISAFQFI